MDLSVIGKAGAPEVLLLGGAEALRPLEKRYCLLLPVFDEESRDEKLEALERELLLHHGGRIRGIYALGGDAGLALRLLARGRVRVGTVVLEGDFELPEDLPPLDSAVTVWYRKKDKAAKKRGDALRELASPLSTLAMKKLPKGMSLSDIRPDLAVLRLEKTYGGGVSVTRAAMVPGSAEEVWRDLCLSPSADRVFLSQMEPIRCEDEALSQLVEGSSKHLKRWSHLIRLESADEGLTYVTDQVELDAGKLNALALPLTELYLKVLQLRRSAAMKKKNHAL